MKVSAISNCYLNQNYTNNSVQRNHKNFESKSGKIIGGIIGGATGAVAGSAIAGGGTIALAAALAASGPVGIGITLAYAIGGAAFTGWLGSGFGDLITSKKDDNQTKT